MKKCLLVLSLSIVRMFSILVEAFDDYAHVAPFCDLPRPDVPK